MSLNYTIEHNGQTWNSSSGVTSLDIKNGSITTSITSATTKTLNCAGKYISNNLIIGDKTLNCANKIMTGNVVITVTPDYAGYIWELNGTNMITYDSSGAQIAKVSMPSTWTCPQSGKYIIELHGKGGDGGRGAGAKDRGWVSSRAYYTYAAGSGGSGGSSGAYGIISLTKNTQYSVGLGDNATFGTYYANKGGNGGNGSASAFSYHTADASGGTAGKAGSSNLSNNLANAGVAGNANRKDHSYGSDSVRADGVAGGASSSYINNSKYGSYGKGGDSQTIASYDSTKNGLSGNNGIILIKKQ